MEKTYNPHAIERQWYPFWEQHGYFAPSGKGAAYSIMIPPPNVTGSLHMGHAFQHAIMDALSRYQRMQGKNTLWQVGTDHAGIATQMVVERKLAAEAGQSRHDLGRQQFVDKIWQWQQQSGGRITDQMRRLGNSVDWAQERFTLDEGFCRAVQEAFVRLYDDGLIYRGKRLVNWDPQLRTAISDLEVDNKTTQGHLWHLRYPLADRSKTDAGKAYVVVATTRPETLLGDTAVAVHPDDPRYQPLIGQQVILPLVNRRIPIVADPHADRDKGTGCVKITPAHDFNDYAVAQRCQLPLINIMTLDGKLGQVAQAFNTDGTVNDTLSTTLPKPYQGLDRSAARQQIVTDLQQAGLLEAIEDHELTVPYGDRSGVIIEPLLTDQWFVRTQPLAAPAIAAVENGQIQFVPRQYQNLYFAWMRDLQDWCISRQLWWGHRIPAWYDDQGNVYVGRSEQEVRRQHDIADTVTLQQDNDVLDTWFSSALWSFATLGWPDPTERLRTFHPTEVLVTGFDIIFFWVARMIMMTLHFIKDDTGAPQIPFKYVYVTGLIRDEHGQKMSKTKGNVLDPLDIIDGIDLERLVHKRTGHMMQPQQATAIECSTRQAFPQGIAAHGTDALRYTLYSLASTGRDINWDKQRLAGYRNFCNKIWNAARYVVLNTQDQDLGQPNSPIEYTLADRWIVSALQRTTTQIIKAMAAFRLDQASRHLHDFIWHQYCDWYLELSKPVLWDDRVSAALKHGARRTLVHILEVSMRLAHPFIPFITEEIWQSIKLPAGVAGDTVMLQAYPNADSTLVDVQAEQDIVWLKDFVTGIRNIRAECGIGPSRRLTVHLVHADDNDLRLLAQNRQFLMMLAKLDAIQVAAKQDDGALVATALVGAMEIRVSMAGLVDKAAEMNRLSKAVAKLAQTIQRLENKLNNAQFVAKAPATVVAQERAKLTDNRSTQATLAAQLAALQDDNTK